MRRACFLIRPRPPPPDSVPLWGFYFVLCWAVFGLYFARHLDSFLKFRMKKLRCVLIIEIIHAENLGNALSHGHIAPNHTSQPPAWLLWCGHLVLAIRCFAVSSGASCSSDTVLFRIFCARPSVQLLISEYNIPHFQSRIFFFFLANVLSFTFSWRLHQKSTKHRRVGLFLDSRLCSIELTSVLSTVPS